MTYKLLVPQTALLYLCNLIVVASMSCHEELATNSTALLGHASGMALFANLHASVL